MLDRTKEPGSVGEPLFLDTVAAVTEAFADGEREVMPRIVGGRYGLSSKEFTPGMVAGVFDELKAERPRRRFTIGINDDVSGTSLDYDATLDIEPPDTARAIFFGLGSDGTVGANKNTIKILGSEEGLHAQGYFVYDSKKSGSQTVVAPALRASSDPGCRTSSSRRGSSAATSSAFSTVSTCSAARRTARRYCSIAHIPRRRSGMRSPARSRSRS